MPFPDLLPMRLTDDGLGQRRLPGRRGRTARWWRPVLGSDIYKSVADHVRAKFGDRGTLFAWDWRKRPQESFEKLDQAIKHRARARRPVGRPAGRTASCCGATPTAGC